MLWIRHVLPLCKSKDSDSDLTWCFRSSSTYQPRLCFHQAFPVFCCISIFGIFPSLCLSLLCPRQVIHSYISPIIVLGMPQQLPSLICSWRNGGAGGGAQNITPGVARAGGKGRVPIRVRDFILMIYTEHNPVSGCFRVFQHLLPIQVHSTHSWMSIINSPDSSRA